MELCKKNLLSCKSAFLQTENDLFMRGTKNRGKLLPLYYRQLIIICITDSLLLLNNSQKFQTNLPRKPFTVVLERAFHFLSAQWSRDRSVSLMQKLILKPLFLFQVLASLRTVRNNFAALTNLQDRAPSKWVSFFGHWTFCSDTFFM